MKLSEVWSLSLAVAKRFSEKRGSNLAAAIAFRAFLGLFACLVLSFAVAGYLNASGRAVGESIISNLGLSGDSADSVLRAVQQAQNSRYNNNLWTSWACVDRHRALNGYCLCMERCVGNPRRRIPRKG